MLLEFNPENIDYDQLLKGVQIGGGGEDVWGRFVGRPQRGAGVGTVLVNFFKTALPRILQSPITRSFLNSTANSLRENVPALAKVEASPVGKAVIDTATNVGADLIQGERLKESAMKRGREAVKTLTGLGRKRKAIGVVKFKKPPKRRSYLTI